MHNGDAVDNDAANKRLKNDTNSVNDDNQANVIEHVNAGAIATLANANKDSNAATKIQYIVTAAIE